MDPKNVNLVSVIPYKIFKACTIIYLDYGQSDTLGLLHTLFGVGNISSAKLLNDKKRNKGNRFFADTLYGFNNNSISHLVYFFITVLGLNHKKKMVTNH